MAVAAPVAIAAAEGAGATTAGTAAAAGGRAAATGTGGRAAASGGGGKGGGSAADLLGAGGGGGGKPGKGNGGNLGGKAMAKGKSSLKGGGAAKYRRWLVAEFIVCMVLLALAPLAKSNSQDLGPVRWMKRGTATCALFVVLGLVSSAGKGAAKAAGMFGALVTLVLLVDQREAFGRLATLLAGSEDEGADQTGVGPDDSTSSGGPVFPDVMEA